uniref:ISXO2-like transposase domain-containing protein n=1 Tax=Octopus bimaculoides TaxID=37653 RepID=A0A0L8FGP9_OCTBM
MRIGNMVAHANKSKLSLQKIFHSVFHFVFEAPISTSALYSGVDNKTAIQWYELCRKVCSGKMLRDKASLSGPSHEVEKEESLYFKRKSHVERIGHQTWVVGCYDPTVKKGFLQRVPDRSAATLEAVIIENVLPAIGIHNRVNHSTNFIDPETGACTNHMEAYWSQIKRRLKYVTGSTGDMKWSCVDESMYREMHGFTVKKNFENTCLNVKNKDGGTDHYIWLAKWISRHSKRAFSKRLKISSNICSVQIGGIDANGQPVVVEMDESKYHRGEWVPWPLGPRRNRESVSKKCFSVEVLECSEQTLTALIQCWILPGSLTVSDGWRSYHNIGILNGDAYTHELIAHEEHFVDPEV